MFLNFISEIQREGAKAETEWEMKKAQRREYEKDMPKDNEYFRKMYMNREEVAEPEMTRFVIIFPILLIVLNFKNDIILN